MLEKLKYPIGKAEIPSEISDILLIEWIKTIEDFPAKLEKLVQHLTDNQLKTC